MSRRIYASTNDRVRAYRWRKKHGVKLLKKAELDLSKLESSDNGLKVDRSVGRVTISKSIRRAVLFRDNNKCKKCGCDACLEIHHIRGVAFGGRNEIDNLVTLCHYCHKYAPYELDEFKSFIDDKLPNNYRFGCELSKGTLWILMNNNNFRRLACIRDSEACSMIIEDFFSELWIMIRDVKDIKKREEMIDRLFEKYKKYDGDKYNFND